MMDAKFKTCYMSKRMRAALKQATDALKDKIRDVQNELTSTDKTPDSILKICSEQIEEMHESIDLIEGWIRRYDDEPTETRN